MFAKVTLIAVLVAAMTTNAFYLPGVAPHHYKSKDLVELEVNRLTSTKTQLAFDYYDLPFCRPEKITKAVANLGEILMGNMIENSPYELKLYQAESCKFLCRQVYTKKDFARFKAKIDEDYTVNVIMDGLPAATHVPDQNSQSTNLAYDHGYHVGGTIPTAGDLKYYLNNHIRITVAYNQREDSDKALIVGFEVEPFSVNHELDREKQWDDQNRHVLCQSALSTDLMRTTRW